MFLTNPQPKLDTKSSFAGELSISISALSLTASLDICCANWYRADMARYQSQPRFSRPSIIICRILSQKDMFNKKIKNEHIFVFYCLSPVYCYLTMILYTHKSRTHVLILLKDGSRNKNMTTNRLKIRGDIQRFIFIYGNFPHLHLESNPYNRIVETPETHLFIIQSQLKQLSQRFILNIQPARQASVYLKILWLHILSECLLISTNHIFRIFFNPAY